MRYKLKLAELLWGETEPTRFFILDTTTGELVRGKNHVLRGFKKQKDAQREINKLNNK